MTGAAETPPLPGLLPSPVVRRYGSGERALLWVVALAPLVVALASRDLWAPDEPRYAQVAREALRDGHWLVPYVNEAPYAEKPPLFFVLVAALSAPFGAVSALTARLTGALFAMGSFLLVARLARLWFADLAMGVTAAALFATMGVVAWNASRAGLDLPLTFFVLLTVERLTVWANGGGLPAAALAGVAWAGAVLVKGPMGFFMPPLAVAGGFLAARRRPPPGAWLPPIVMAASGLAWLLPALAAGGDAYRARLLGQIGERVSGEERGHVRPVTYYLVGILGQALPWTAHLFAGFGAVSRIRGVPAEHRFGLGAALSTSLATLVVLTFVATKREVYMIPALAFAAIAAAYAIHRGLFPRVLAAGSAVAFGMLAGLAAACALAPVFSRRLGEPLSTLLAWHRGDLLLSVLAAAIVFGAGAWAVWRVRPRRSAAVRATAVALIGGGSLLAVTFFPVVDPVLTWRDAAAVVPPDARVAEHGIGQAGVMLWSFSTRRIETLHTPEQVVRALDPTGPKTVVVAESGAWDAVLRAADASHADWRAVLDSAHVLWRNRVSHRQVVLVSN